MDGTAKIPAAVRQVIELAQYAADAGGVSAGADAAHEDVEVARLGGEFEGQRSVRGGVVRVVVLVRAPGVRVLCEQFGDLVPPGLLPTAPRVRVGDDVDLGAVHAEQPCHGGFEPGIGDQGDGVTVHHSSQREAEPEGATGGLDDPPAGTQITTGAGAFDHVEAGSVLDAARVEALQLRPEAVAGRGQGLGDTEEWGVADEGGEG